MRARTTRLWRRDGPARPGGVLAALLLCCAVAITIAKADGDDDVFVTYEDTYRDWLLRPTGPADLLVPDPGIHRPADLLEITMGMWEPDEPPEGEPLENLFDGEFDDDGLFLRLDVWLDGLVNPPGNTQPEAFDAFDPFAYGDHPVFGFVEVDMDLDEETGGELDAPEYRYVGNAVRFGGKPAVDRLEDRFALDASAFDADFLTPPFVDRSGEEFHLALLGSLFDCGDILPKIGDGDCLFEVGETWWIEGAWFHRAHGYEPFSLAEGGDQSGAYEPVSTLQFSHDADADATCVSVVFPLTNEGAAEMRGEDPEPPNSNPSDQFSVREALIDLHLSAVFVLQYPTGEPEEGIIIEWEDQDPDDFLEPAEWAVTAILGTSYANYDSSGEYFVWTDIYPDGLRGDVNGDAEADQTDVALIEDFIVEHDGDDGELDGRVVLDDFPVNFSVFDVNHGGVVDNMDTLLVSPPGDVDSDEDVDLIDFASMQVCGSGADVPFGSWECGVVDLDMDGDVDKEDWARFLDRWSGSGDEEEED